MYFISCRTEGLYCRILLTLSWPVGHICPTYKESFQVPWGNIIPIFSMLPATFKYLYSVEPVRIYFPAKQPCTNNTVCNAACSIAHSIICAWLFRGKMHSDWFKGIEMFKVNGSMEKTGILLSQLTWKDPL